MNWIWALVYILLAPILGGLLAGADRIVTARLQARIGPPLLQPFYDAFKLFQKRGMIVNRFQNYYVTCFLVFMAIAGAIFFGGGDLLLAVFILTVAAIFLVLGAYSAGSPYSTVGAERELLQMMAYEPMLLITAVSFYAATGSFRVVDIASHGVVLAGILPGVFLGFLFILTIKLRKSPFDLSTSHHAHQELVKGVTTEFSGPTLGLIEIAHWYENILLLGFVYLFFAALSPVFAVLATLLAYAIEILVDNTYARLNWRIAIISSWIVAAIPGALNLLVVYAWLR